MVIVLYQRKYNGCFIKIRSKHSSNTLVSLLRIFMKQTLIRVKKYKYGFVLQTAHIFAQPCCRRVILYKVTSRKLFQLCNISMYILRTTLYVGWYTKLKNCILIMRWYLNEEWLSLIAMRNFKPYIIIIVHSFLKYNPSCACAVFS